MCVKLSERTGREISPDCPAVGCNVDVTNANTDPDPDPGANANADADADADADEEAYLLHCSL